MATTRALILVAHGSRRQDSNDEIRDVGRRLFARLGTHYMHYDTAFLELADPLIPDAVNAAVAAGAEHIDIFPYFLSQGRHVQEDVPRHVRETLAEKPQIRWHYLPYIGSGDGIIQLATEIIRQSAD